MRFNRSLTLFSAMLLGACAVAAPDEEDSTGVIRSEQNRDNDRDRDRGRNDRRPEDSRLVFARSIATGIPGAGAITQVGDFLRGSPFHDRPTFLPFTAPGGVANRDRLFVASSSNFGAPIGHVGQYPGTVLSIDPSAHSTITNTFAAAGGQASTESGRVIVYASNNAAFVNSLFEPQAVTATEMAVSLPTGISLNNGNGRPWVANAPNGTNGDGTITVLDPGGFPLAGAPFPTAGGVFSGNLTNRSPATTHGLTKGATGTAIFSKSPDNSGRAVFVAAEADGSIVQVHVQKGVDGLVPAGTLAALSALTPANAESFDRRVVTRNGMAFNWAPKRVLYVTDPKKDRVLAFDITDDGSIFTAAAPRVLRADRDGDREHGSHHCDRDRDDDDDDDVFNIPVDVQPVISETASENFASNSSLAVGSDLYVLNRGNNTVVRVTQDGELVAKRTILVVDHPFFRANGMAVSPDGRTIWITGQTPFGGGLVTKIDGFGSGPIMPKLMAQAATAGASSTNALGGFFFNKSFGLNEGVGPLFNEQSCAGCHSDPFPGGMSSTIFDTFVSPGGPVARFHSISEIGGKCKLPTGTGGASTLSKRSSMTLRNSSLIDFVSPTDIKNNAALQPVEVRGRPNILADGRVGKFGWKAGTASLVEFMGGAFRNEQGLTNGLVRQDEVNGCGANDIKPELDALPLVTTSAFMTTLDAPAPTAACTSSPGAAIFATTGCASCHTASFAGPGFRANLYSDLLLHDMGPALADGFVQGSATGSEFRTMTLTKLDERSHFLHDGRANDLTSAITAHGGQGAASATAFSALSATDKAALFAFLGCL